MTISPVLYSSRSEEWGTPPIIFEQLNKEFHFTLDAAASDANHKCSRYFTITENGLHQNWGQERVFLNPPYGKMIGQWMQKAYEESQRGALVVCLVHARTDTKWFHTWVYGKAEIRFVKGRLTFQGAKWNSPFPSLVVIYRPTQEASR